MKRLAFLDLIREDLKRVEEVLQEQPPGQHEAITMAIKHLVEGGGKRIRPAMVLLGANICGAEMDRAVLAGAAVEMLHTATLVHDDLIDGSLMRRGIETLNARWTPGATVLTGDYVFARAAFLVASTGSIHLVRRFAETLMVICNGEIHQMFGGRDQHITQKVYIQRIFAKTASLIGLSTEAGAILAETDEETQRRLRAAGEQLGLAFQIVDDVLDLVADEETLGKPVGSDLRQGLVTLPVLLFIEREPDHPALRRALVPSPSQDAVQEAVRAIANSPVIEQALQIAQGYHDQAVTALRQFPSSPYRQALLDLAAFSIRRRF